jgi:hypothetical protein
MVTYADGTAIAGAIDRLPRAISALHGTGPAKRHARIINDGSDESDAFTDARAAEHAANDLADAPGPLKSQIRRRDQRALEAARGSHRAHCRILLGGSVTCAILTPPRYYNLKGVRKLVRQRDEYEQIFTNLINDLPLRADCDRHAFRLSLLGAMNWTVFWYTAGGRLSVDDVGRQIALMVRGAASGAPTKK